MFGASKSVAAIAALLVAASLTGCGNLRLYSETRDKQGTAARDAWAKVDLTGMAATERANLKKLLDVELETQDQLATGIRNHRLRALVEGKVDEDLVEPANALLVQLVGSPQKFLDAQKALDSGRTRTRALDIARSNFDGLGFVAPSCAEVTGGEIPNRLRPAVNRLSPGQQAAVKPLIEQLNKACKDADKDPDAAAPDIYATLDGEMKAAVEQYNEDKKRLDEISADADGRKKAYEDARAAYDAAVEAYQRDSNLLADVQKKAGAVGDAAAKLADLQDAVSVQLLSEGRLKSIDAFFKTVASTDPSKDLPKGTNRTAAALALLPDLVDSSREALAEAKKPLTYPLLLRRNYEQLRLEAATREIEARKAMVSLSRDLMDATYLEAHQLWLASQSLGNDSVKKHHKETVLVAFAAGNKDERELLFNGAARYLDVLNRLEARRYKLQYMRLAASHELSLAYSEVNIKQWESLIGTTVAQLADYSAGGIKSQEISDLLNAAGLIWIGVGVNK